MLTHYLRIAWRSIRRHPWYSLINIGCLAIGLAAAMTMMLYILHEHSYDSWHANARRIFAVSTSTGSAGSPWTSYQLSYLAGPAGLADPAVESMARMMPAYVGVELENPASPSVRFRETTGFIFADSNFFRFFSFRLLEGSADNVLSRPFTIVLTQSAAKKYFGNADPVGRTLMADGRYPLQVTGVSADVPSNSSINYDMIASLSTMKGLEDYRPYLDNQQIESGAFYTWFRLRSAADTARVGRNLSHVAMVAAGKFARKEGSYAYGQTETHQFSLLPIGDTHLHAYEGWHGKYLPAFTWVAALILLLALVNYMSLATARSAMRAREVGVRKVIGAGRPGIAGQFYTESAMNAVLAFAAGIFLFLAFRPTFSSLMQLNIDLRFLYSPMALTAFLILLVLVILAAGSYPSIVLSAFRPVMVLYGRLSRQRSSERVRKVFLVFQFTLSMTLMTCGFIIAKELYYIRHTDTGVDRANIVMLPFANTMHDYDAYQKAVAAIPGVERVATAGTELFGGIFSELAQLPGDPSPHQMGLILADSNLIPLLNLKWTEKPANASRWYDTNHLAVNEAAVQAFRWFGRATGQRFKSGGTNVTVAGVLKDFNFFSLHQAIAPMEIKIYPRIQDGWEDGITGVLYARIRPHVNVPSVLDAARRIYTRHDGQTPFEFTFLDDEFNKQYTAEDRLAGLIDIFTLVTIIIATMGLFALATFSAQQRVREIGIRKVLGASVTSISALLSGNFLRPIGLSILIASPIAWWTMQEWLRNYAYRTSISWWTFPMVGGSLLLVALGTVLFRTIRAARANPTMNLRSE